MPKFLLILVLALAPHVSFAHDSRSCEDDLVSEVTLGGHFAYLQSKDLLLNQFDDVLAAKKLLVEGGGLCASTCVVNVLHAAYIFKYRFTQTFQYEAPGLLEEIVTLIKLKFQKDARMGMNLLEMDFALNVLAPGYGLEIKTTGIYASPDQAIHFLDVMPKADELVIVAIATEDGESHALVVTHGYEQSQVLRLSDPMESNKGLITPTQEALTLGGNQTVGIDYPVSIPTCYSGTIIGALKVCIKP